MGKSNEADADREGRARIAASAAVAAVAGDDVENELLEADVVLAEGGRRQDRGHVREFGAAALRADDDFAVGQILFVAQLEVGHAAAGRVARVETGERVHDRRTDVAGLRGFLRSLGDVVDQIRQIGLDGFAPADPNGRESGRLADGLVDFAGKGNVLDHRFKEGLRFNVGFLGRCVLHEVKNVGRNGGASVMEKVEYLLIWDLKTCHSGLTFRFDCGKQSV